MNASILRKSVLLGGLVTLSFSLGIQPAFSHGNDGHGGNEAKTITVNCLYRSINRALKRHRKKALVIIVKGTCHEDVFIDRNRVTLVAATPGADGVTSQAADGAAVTVSGAQSVVIDGLRLQSAGGGFPAGVFVTRNGEADIQNALIENNAYGIRANHGGFFLVRDSNVIDNRNYGIFLTDAGHARVQDSTIEISNSNKGSSAAIGAFRGVNLRLRGDNVIRNTGDDGEPGNADDGFSLDLFHSVDFRQDGGHTTFIGPMEFGNLTNASLRDPEIRGAIDVSGGSRVDIRSSSTGSDELTGESDITVSSNSRLAFSRPGIIADVGSINVDEFSSLFLRDNVNVTAAGEMRVNGSRFSMAPGSSIEVRDGLLIEDFSVMFADDGTSISADMHFGGSITKVNLFGSDVTYTGNMLFSPRSSLDFGPNASIDGNIDCGGGEVFFEGPFSFISGGLVNCPF